MTDRPDQPDSPTEKQVAEPTAVQPVAPVGDTIPTTTPEVLADAAGAVSGIAPDWPEAPGTGPAAGAATPSAPGGATPRTPFGPPTPPPAPDPAARTQGQPWSSPQSQPWGQPGQPVRPGEPWPQGQQWGQPPGQPWGAPPGQQPHPYGQYPPPSQQPAPFGQDPYQPYGPPAAYRGIPVPRGPAEGVKSAKTLLLVTVGLVVLALFTSFIAAVTSSWGLIPTGVTVFVGMLNLAALVCGALALWRIAGAMEGLTRKVEELRKD